MEFDKHLILERFGNLLTIEKDKITTSPALRINDNFRLTIQTLMASNQSIMNRLRKIANPNEKMKELNPQDRIRGSPGWIIAEVTEKVKMK